mmetsp:Transcript_11453/g.18201  ORF Transcript_11453/g.18201 Transcript_11453/m.18201 type:complete len:246 (-) Transcript_11453:790-1527(-)
MRSRAACISFSSLSIILCCAASCRCARSAMRCLYSAACEGARAKSLLMRADATETSMSPILPSPTTFASLSRGICALQAAASASCSLSFAYGVACATRLLLLACILMFLKSRALPLLTHSDCLSPLSAKRIARGKLPPVIRGCITSLFRTVYEPGPTCRSSRISFGVSSHLGSTSACAVSKRRRTLSGTANHHVLMPFVCGNHLTVSGHPIGTSKCRRAALPNHRFSFFCVGKMCTNIGRREEAG